MKNIIITACLGFTIGALLMVALNSLGRVIKVEIVAPEAGYTAIQREQIELLMESKK